MTIMGKILVILNLVVALLVGGLLVYYSATSTNWHAGHDAVVQELSSARGNTAAVLDELKYTKSERDGLKTQLEKLKADLAAAKTDYESRIEEVRNLAKANETKALKAQTLADASAEEAKRLRKEVTMHEEAVKERDLTLAKKEERIKDLLGRVVGAENAVASLKARNGQLLTQVETLTKKVIKLEAGPATTSVVRGRDTKNPPSVYVRGVVTNVNREDGLVQVSLGSDEGVNEGNTLEVYRLRPRPEYLGTIKIMDARHHTAVGRVMRSEGQAHNPISRGDEVASRIISR